MRKRMKKSMGKRVLSVLLAVTMCLSMGTMRVQAETTTPEDQTENTDQTSGLDFSDGTVDAEAITTYIKSFADTEGKYAAPVDLVITLPATLDTVGWGKLREGISNAGSPQIHLTLEGVTVFGANNTGVLYGLTQIVSISLPKVTRVEDGSFSNLGNLQEISFGTPLTYVGVEAFSWISSKYSITLNLPCQQPVMVESQNESQSPCWTPGTGLLINKGTGSFCGGSFRTVECIHPAEEKQSWRVREKNIFQHEFAYETCGYVTEVADHTIGSDGKCTGCGYNGYSPYGLYVGGVPVTAANASNVLGNGTVSYDSTNHILTLNNATIYGAESVRGAGIYDTGNDTLVLQLKGTNTITGTYSEDWHVDAGVYTDGRLQIQEDGTGSLTTTTAWIEEQDQVKISETSAGIFARKGLSMLSGTLHALGGTATDSSFGIFSWDHNTHLGWEMILEKVSISGGTATFESGDIYSVSNGVVMKDKDMNALAGELDLSAYPSARWTYSVTERVPQEDGSFQWVATAEAPHMQSFIPSYLLLLGTGYVHVEPGEYQVKEYPMAENGAAFVVEAKDPSTGAWGTIPESVDISYEWYRNVPKQVVGVEKEAGQPVGIILDETGSYSAESKKWIPINTSDEDPEATHYLQLVVPAKAGDRITVTVLPTGTGNVTGKFSGLCTIGSSMTTQLQSAFTGIVTQDVLLSSKELEDAEMLPEGSTDQTYAMITVTAKGSFSAEIMINTPEKVDTTADRPHIFSCDQAGNYFGVASVSRSVDGATVVDVMESPSFEYLPIYTITFEAGAGDCGTDYTQTQNGSGRFEPEYELPIATAEGYEFLGWVLNDGIPVTAETVFEGSATVYAKWKAVVSQAPAAKTDLVYTGSAQALITAGNTASGSTMMYSLSEDGPFDTEIPTGLGAGSYTVWYYAKADDGKINGVTIDHEDGSKASVTVTIAKADYDMSHAQWDYTEAFDYNGLEHEVQVTGLPEGVTVNSYTGNTATKVGSYTAQVTFHVADDDNYNIPVLADLNWRIKNDWAPTQYTVSGSNDNGWWNQDVVITAADGYLLSLTDTVDGTWSETLTGAVEGADSTITFYQKNVATGAISQAKTVEYKLDKNTESSDTAGNVYLDEENRWNSVIDTITYDLFYKDQVTVKVDAIDDLSGVDKIYYYEAAQAMMLEQIQTITDWTVLPAGGVAVPVEDAKQFVYYIRIVDLAGNERYLSTNGAQYDTTAPVVTGVEDGESYYTTQKIVVSDDNLVSITVNEAAIQDLESAIILEGNKEATYVIQAVDKAGNITTVTVTMEPVAAMGTIMEGLTEENVTSQQKESIQAVVDEIAALLQAEDTTDEEKTALEQVKKKAAELLAQIEEAEAALNTDNTKAAEGITGDNVTPENKTVLEEAKKDLEEALKKYGGESGDGSDDSAETFDNYTEEEKKEIQDEIDRIDDLLESLQKVEEVEEKIEETIQTLPETVEPDDKEAIDAYEALQKEYDSLTDHEKTLVDPAVKEKLEELADALAAYDIIEGAGARWTRDSGKSLTFKSNGYYEKLVHIEVDGKIVDSKYYEVKAGSTIVTLKAEFLQNLSVSPHTFKMVYTDGECRCLFSVKAAPVVQQPTVDAPMTGDHSHLGLWLALLVVSGSVLALGQRKRKHE